MSFSLTDLRCGLEWRGTSLSTVFAQRRNVARPAFLAMLADVVRFNRLARSMLAGENTRGPEQERWLTCWPRAAGRRASWKSRLLIPLGSAIWSADPTTSRRYRPARSSSSSAATGCSARRPALLAHGHRRFAALRESILQPLRNQCRLHLRCGVTKLRRQQRGVELLTAGGPTMLTMSSSPRTATRPWPCWATRPPRSAVCSVPSA